MGFSRRDWVTTIGIVLLGSMLIAGALSGLLQISEISAAAAYVLMGGIATCAGILVAPRILRKEENEQGLVENKQADELDELKEREKVYAQLSRLMAKLIRDGRPSMLQNITIPPGKATLRVLEAAFKDVDKFFDDNASVIESAISHQWDDACQPIMKHYGGAYLEYDLDLDSLRALSDQLDERLKSIRLQGGESHNSFCTSLQEAQPLGVTHYGISRHLTDCQCTCHK